MTVEKAVNNLESRMQSTEQQVGFHEKELEAIKSMHSETMAQGKETNKMLHEVAQQLAINAERSAQTNDGLERAFSEIKGVNESVSNIDKRVQKIENGQEARQKMIATWWKPAAIGIVVICIAAIGAANKYL